MYSQYHINFYTGKKCKKLNVFITILDSKQHRTTQRTTQRTMVNAWYIKVASNGKYFDDILDKSLSDKSIGIGFGILIDYNLTTQPDRNNTWNDKLCSKKQKELRENNFDNFVRQMNIGDIIFLCKGENTILYMAEVSSDYYFDDSYTIVFPTYSLPHRRHITNIKSFNTIAPKRMLGTLYKV
jgi:hypothetical protein